MVPSQITTSHARTLRVLIVEDSAADAELVMAVLQAEGYSITSTRVETGPHLLAALEQEPWDVVVSDYSLPSFDAPSALAIVQAFNPELPFIIVSGTIGEEVAVTALKAGAADFLVKGRLSRLVPAIERELREVQLRQQRAQERAVLEERLRQSQKLEGIGQLAGGIAHDFNNLLTAITGYTEMVLDQIGTDKPISADLHEIRDAANRAVMLTKQLLAFSRKQPLNIVAVDVNEIIGGMQGMLKRLIREDIDIRLRLGSDLPRILADRVQLEQVVMNLVVNARDAMPNGGVVTVESKTVTAVDVASTFLAKVTPGMTYVRVTVSDTGVGMDTATRARIFEPFFTTKGEGDGTGLGLATVYGVVQQLGGEVAVDSAVGKGTTFHLYFPCAPSTSTDGDSSSKTTQKTVAPLATNRETVLVVEDQRSVRQLVCRILARHGYTVIEAANAMHAIEIAEQAGHVCDLVITDVVMPTMNGAELVTRLRAIRPQLKALYISGYAGDDLRRRIEAEATATVLQKPFTASVLLRAVRESIDAL